MRPAATWLLLPAVLLACDVSVGSGSGEPHEADDAAVPRPRRPDDEPAGGSDRSLRFYYGPMKAMSAESILYSVAAMTGHDFGSWDYTAPDPATRAFADNANGGPYYRHCRLLGGCMEHRIPLGRTSFVGTAYVLELERVAVEACYDREAFGMFPGRVAPGDGVRPVDVIDHQYVTAFGAAPTDQERDLSVAYFESHLASPEHGDISPLESAGRGHCRALLTTNRFLFY